MRRGGCRVSPDECRTGISFDATPLVLDEPKVVAETELIGLPPSGASGRPAEDLNGALSRVERELIGLLGRRGARMAAKRNSRSNSSGQNGDHTERESLVNPGRLDFAKADEALKKIVRENKEWLKEMASR